MKVPVTGAAGCPGTHVAIRARAPRPQRRLAVLDSMTCAGSLTSLDTIATYQANQDGWRAAKVDAEGPHDRVGR